MNAAAFDYDRFGPHGEKLKANRAKLDQALAQGLKPPPRMSVSEWAARYRRFPDDAPVPGPWKHATTPELVEIMDALNPHDPCEEVALIKCSQSGGSAAGENWLGYISDLRPGPVLVVNPGLKDSWDWAAEKFWPMVEATPKLDPARGGTIRGLGLADGDGSTKLKIRFARGGYILLAGANSSAGLRQRTVRYAIEDDLDDFPDDLEGQGSPEEMVSSRLKVWKSRGLSKRLKISTPTIQGASKIEAAFIAADRRRFHLKCPECGDRFAPEWADIRWPDGKPAEAQLAAPCCGSMIEHWRKPEMKLPDGWLSEEIDGEKPPRMMSEEAFQGWRARMPASIRRGFHLSGIISSFQTWADMAGQFVAAQGDVNKLKTWTNLVLGWVFQLNRDVPDDEKLKALREQDWGVGQMPAGPVVTTLGVDVQADGIYLELVGWGPDAESWQLDARFIPGATDVKMEGAWAELDAYSKRGVVFPGGKQAPIDQECVDAGYNTDAAHAYCGRRPRRLAVYGRSGWKLPVLGRGEAQKYVHQGGKAGKASKRLGDRAYQVGTFTAKANWYGFLRSTIAYAARRIEEGEGTDKPRGVCHFSRDTSDDWFDMATAEAIVSKIVNGHPQRVWAVMPGRENHYLDCRVYNMAATEKLLLDTLQPADWARLRAERYEAKHPDQGDLLGDGLAAPRSPVAQPKPKDAGDGFIDAKDDYL